MDNAAATTLLQEGLRRLCVEMPQEVALAQVVFAQELLRWNAKVNLTAIVQLEAVVEKHLIDSLTVVPWLAGNEVVLDLGAGAGLPGIPLALAVPGLQVTLVDAVAKKVGFIKHAAAMLGLASRVKAVHARAEGKPESEKLPRADLVVSRALMDVGPWLALAAAYVRPGGSVVAMMGKGVGLEGQLAELGAENGFAVQDVKHLALPFSGDPRTLVRFMRRK